MWNDGKPKTKKEIVDINIRHKQVLNDICVYQVKINFGNIVLNDITRFCYASELKILYTNPIAFSKKESRTLDNYSLFKSDIKEAIRQNHENMFEKNYRIDKLDVLEHKPEDNENIIFGKFDVDTENFYEYGFSFPCPKSIYFDYINGDIDNAHYDLNKVVKILNNRKDVKSSLIHNIPYYNADDNRNLYVSFEWHPTNEDWKKYFESDYFEKFNRYNYIANEILGLKDCLLKEDDI